MQGGGAFRKSRRSSFLGGKERGGVFPLLACRGLGVCFRQAEGLGCAVLGKGTAWSMETLLTFHGASKGSRPGQLYPAWCFQVASVVCM